jgi:uncharacterized protein (TIGR03382 family)
VERTFVAFTITFLAHAFAHAAPPPPTTAKFSTTETSPRGFAFARQAVKPPTVRSGSALAQSRTIYLNRDGAVLWPGDNDARSAKSSVVQEPTEITPWDIDDETWAETVDCVTDLYARFDVTVTDLDPGNVPHIEAVFGGHPFDVGLPDNVAGVSPFRSDCGVIENSVVFTFTDVLPDDSRLMCEVMAQEIAHSYGLDHEMLASDPMTYLDYAGERTFKDVMAPCGEFGNRMCGIDGSICRERQNSVQLLESRLGRRGNPSGAPRDPNESPSTTEPEAGGCAASGSGGGFLLPLLLLIRSRRSRRLRAAPHR